MQPSFHEIQKFNKWWHYFLAGFPVLIVGGTWLGLWTRILKNESEQLSSVILPMGIPFFFTVLAFLWFLSLRLVTTINIEGITVNYAGMPFCKRTILWSDMRSVSVTDYSPLSDYGGWGVRYSLSGNGWCYNVAGNKGIRIIYQNGKVFLIGTQQSEEEAQTIIDHYFKIN